MARRQSKRKRHLTKRAVAVSLVLVVGIAIAGAVVLRQRGLAPEALLARAEQQLAGGNVAAAIIDLKAVNARDAGNRRARLLLGQTYLDTGNAAAALKELQKARDLGDASPAVAQSIVRAMILTSRFDEAATEMALHGVSEKPEWLVLRGMLALAQQRLDDARGAFKAALAAEPDNTEARRGLMQTELAAGNPELARAELDSLLAATGTDPVLWTIKGELDLHDGQAEQALEAYRKALQLAPGGTMASLGLARAELALGRHDQATNQLDKLGEAAKADPRVNFVRAQIAEAKGDKDSALLFLRDVLQEIPGHRESLVMAARLNFSLGEFSRAEDFIGRLLAIEPNNAAANRMLGAIQLASGRLDGIAQLGAADAGAAPGPQDPGMLALLGTTYLKYGKFEDSRKSLEQAVALAPDSLPIRTQLALSKLSTGKPAEAVTDLEAILAEDPGFVQADIMLALAHLAQKQTEAALAAAGELVRKHPDDALPHNVLGYVLESSGDKAAARQAYEAALGKDAAFHPARINLARLAIQAGDLAAGKEQLDAIVEREPYQPFALLGLAALALQDQRFDEAERLWLLARKHNPEAVAPRLLLAKHYRVRGNAVQAETMAREAYRLAPFAPQVQAEYAAAMLDAGKNDQALVAARALVERAPNSVEGLELLARSYNQLGDEAGLTDTLERIAAIAPEAVGAQMLLGRLAWRRKDFEAGRRIVESLKAKDDTAASGFELEGELYEIQGEDERALTAFETAFERSPDSAKLLKLERVERRLGKPGTRLTDWLQQHPDDLQVRLVQATYLQQSGENADAIAQYEQMLEAKGDNPVVLNNLAWLYFEAQDARAGDLARRAFEAAPELPEVVDTYGWVLFMQGQREQGLEILEKAAKLAPANPDIAYHLASALNDAGQAARARALLEELLKGEHEVFSLRKDAESLLAKMQP